MPDKPEKPVNLNVSPGLRAAVGLGGPAAGLILGALLGGKRNRTVGAILGAILGAGGSAAALKGLQNRKVENFLVDEAVKAFPGLMRRRHGVSLSADSLGDEGRKKGLTMLRSFWEAAGEGKPMFTLPPAKLPAIRTGRELRQALEK
jgi:hypothetical protein